jgi:hypothetical protein
MKKIEKAFRTDRYEIQIVQYQIEKSDYTEGPMGPVATAAAMDVPIPYMMIGPVGGPLARFDGVDLRVLQTLIESVSLFAVIGPQLPRGCYPGA